MMNQHQLRDFYVEHLETQLLPFWKRAIDEVNDWHITGFDNEGKNLLHQNKFVWSQKAAFLWLWSRLSVLCSKGEL